MTASWTKKRARFPEPWYAAQPATTLSDDALHLLAWVRESPSLDALGRRFRINRDTEHFGWDRWRTVHAARELRSSVHAGAFRPARRITIDKAVRALVFNRDGRACRTCSCRDQTMLTLGHHPVPYSRGGSDHHTNLIAQCGPCNQAAGDSETVASPL